jgi:4-amino-4-deoxy-L-arabinose transferase-like glycosyltransferase
MRVQERVQGGVGALRRPPKAFGAARRSYHASMLVIVICFLAVAARLILINQPYVDHWSWRQSDVAAIARNFLQNGFHFGYPQINWAGDVGTEFPILPFMAALCYTFAGVHEWIGRAQAVILFAVSLPFFFLLVREVFDSTAAVWATFFYGFAPVNIFAGRSFMPDVPSLSLAIIGLCFFLRWMEDRKPGSFLAAATAISLCLLIKITNIIVLAPVVYLAVAEGGDLGSSERSGAGAGRGQRPRLQSFVLFSAIALVPSGIWYWHAHQIANKFYPHHFFGAGGIRVESFSWYWHIAQQTLVSGLTPVLSLMALLGLFVPRPRDRKYFRLFFWWLVAMVLFVIVVV